MVEAVITLAVGISIERIATLFSWLAVTFFAVVLPLGLRRTVIRDFSPTQRRALTGLVFIGIVTHLAAISIVPRIMEATTGIPHIAPRDPKYFETLGWSLAQQPLSEWRLQAGKSYPLVVASIYRVFGRIPFAVRSLNVVSFVILVIYSCRLAQRIFTETVVSILGVFLVLSPTFFVLSVRIGHDMLVITLSVVGLFYAYEMDQFESITAFIGFLASIIGMYFLREQVCYLMLFTLVMWYPVRYAHDNWSRFTSTASRRLGVISAATVIFASGLTVGYILDLFTVVDRTLDSWVRWKLTELESTSGLVAQVMSTPTFIRLFLGIPVFLALPFPPWEIYFGPYSLSWKLYAGGTIVLHLLLPFLILGIKQSLYNNLDTTFPLLIFLVGYVVAVSVVFTGASVPRYRAQILPFGMMFVALGIQFSRGHFRFLVTYYVVYGFGLLAYIIMLT